MGSNSNVPQTFYVNCGRYNDVKCSQFSFICFVRTTLSRTLFSIFIPFQSVLQFTFIFIFIFMWLYSFTVLCIRIYSIRLKVYAVENPHFQARGGNPIILSVIKYQSWRKTIPFVLMTWNEDYRSTVKGTDRWDWIKMHHIAGWRHFCICFFFMFFLFTSAIPWSGSVWVWIVFKTSILCHFWGLLSKLSVKNRGKEARRSSIHN